MIYCITPAKYHFPNSHDLSKWFFQPVRTKSSNNKAVRNIPYSSHNNEYIHTHTSKILLNIRKRRAKEIAYCLEKTVQEIMNPQASRYILREISKNPSINRTGFLLLYIDTFFRFNFLKLSTNACSHCCLDKARQTMTVDETIGYPDQLRDGLFFYPCPSSVIFSFVYQLLVLLWLL